ncbi:MAG: SHOCT domain-containing protein [Thermoleophilia bacterium]
MLLSRTTVVGRPAAALTVLEERFARGDIGPEEFHQRRNDLG